MSLLGYGAHNDNKTHFSRHQNLEEIYHETQTLYRLAYYPKLIGDTPDCSYIDINDIPRENCYESPKNLAKRKS